MKKIGYLDGLRGVAAFQVVFHHFILAFYPALFSGPNIKTHLPGDWEVFLSGSPFNFFWDGNFSVCIFFVLSGFVLSHKFFLNKDQELITASAFKRYFRLALPVAFSILCVYILMELSLFYNFSVGSISGSDWLKYFWNFEPNFIDAFRQAFVGTFFAETFSYNAILWTIACEFAGSFLVFGFLAIFGKSKRRSWVYAFLILVFYQTYYLAFILGMLISDLFAHQQAILRKFDAKKFLGMLLLLLGLFLASFPIGRDPQETMYSFINFSWFDDVAVFYHIIGAFCLMIVLLDSQKLKKIFAFRPFVFLGKISFTMYLLHFIILGSFSSFVFLKLQPIMSYHWAVALCFLVSVPVVLLVSYLAYIYVDKKAIDFSRFVYKKFSKLD